MNLSLILNLTAAAPAQGPAQMPIETPEIASFQDFLALMGLSPLPAEQAEEGTTNAVAEPAAEATGNFLPPVLPDLPVLPEPAALLLPAPLAAIALPPMQTDTQPQTQSATVTSPQLPVVATAQQHAAAPQAVAEQAQLPMPTDAGTAPAKPAPVMQSGALTIAIVATQQDAAVSVSPVERTVATSQAMLAQVHIGQGGQVPTGQPRVSARKSDEAALRMPTAATPASTEIVEAEPATTPLSPATVQPASAVPQAVAVLADTPVAPQIAAPGAPAPATETAAPRHDFAAVVDKLSEARELAQPGRAQMSLLHREFGQVTVQFALAGEALKVAMHSPDQAFAPAVQAALAERPLTSLADAARADTAAPRNDSMAATTNAWASGPQADGQRQQDAQQRSQHNRGPAAQVLRQSATDDQTARQSPQQGGGRFA